MFVSIIIPLIKINDYVREAIPHLLNLDYDNFEIIILPNELSGSEQNEFTDSRIRFIPTVKSAPAYKRDLGARTARGEILAFLDDDAYPKKDWLKNAAKHFDNQEVGAVGGPAVTPKSDSFTAQLSGAVYTSFLGGGSYAYRYWPGKKIREVDDYPSVNLLVRKDLFLEIGGFDSHYWPGEDTKLCLDIIKKGKKIIYDPAVFVWHHRRPSIFKHLKQVANYAMHRGHFVKKFPETSRRLSYFVPSLFVLFLIFVGAAAYFTKIALYIYLAVVAIYLTGLLISAMGELFRTKNILISALVAPLIFLTHFVYGVAFVVGLIKKELKQ